jgi:hypothetical protein
VFETPGLKELSASENFVVEEKTAKRMKVKSLLNFRVYTQAISSPPPSLFDEMKTNITLLENVQVMKVDNFT